MTSGASTPRTAMLVVALLLSACATPTGLSPFTSDGCSLFPDRALAGRADWCHCCVAHDLAYWSGGTADERLAADDTLRACVVAASGSTALGEVMFAGVRSGGGPEHTTPYRWGYGWPQVRPYGALSPSEAAQVSTLRPKDLVDATTRVCRGAPR